MELNVYIGDTKAGTLDIEANEPFYGFTYDSQYLASPYALPLSLSLPLRKLRYPGVLAQPYFEGLLPEGESRNAIARRLGIPRSSSVKLIRALGRDCVGDVSIVEEADNVGLGSDSGNGSGIQTHIPLEGGLLSIAKNPHVIIPRLQEDMRLSLAGGQEKIALYHKQGDSLRDGWFIPVLGMPTTHIIKPGTLEAYYPHITLNEFLCLRASSACGIVTVDADVLFPETPVIVIRRYDRTINEISKNGFYTVNRLHQEDCCQASGIKSEIKYEHDGGPGFKLIRDILVTHCQNPMDDVVMLVKWGIFNYLIGNCDAHAKNLSLLYNTDGTVSLAPVYDIISTVIYDGRYGSKLSRNLGMRIGLHESIDRVNSEDFAVFASDVNMRLRQIKLYGEELMHILPSAFGSACDIAESCGFTGAREIVERILRGCDRRAIMLI